MHSTYLAFSGAVCVQNSSTYYSFYCLCSNFPTDNAKDTLLCPNWFNILLPWPIVRSPLPLSYTLAKLQPLTVGRLFYGAEQAKKNTGWVWAWGVSGRLWRSHYPVVPSLSTPPGHRWNLKLTTASIVQFSPPHQSHTPSVCPHASPRIDIHRSFLLQMMSNQAWTQTWELGCQPKHHKRLLLEIEINKSVPC